MTSIPTAPKPIFKWFSNAPEKSKISLKMVGTIIVTAAHCCVQSSWFMCIILSSSERTAWGKAHMLSVLWWFNPGIGCDEGSWDGELPWIICVRAQSRRTLQWPHALEPARLLCPWDFPGKNTGVGCQYFLLQEIFRTQGLNLHLLCLLYWHYFPVLPPGKPVSFTITSYFFCSVLTVCLLIMVIIIFLPAVITPVDRLTLERLLMTVVFTLLLRRLVFQWASPQALCWNHISRGQR